jgi:hypothetical protein
VTQIDPRRLFVGHTTTRSSSFAPDGSQLPQLNRWAVMSLTPGITELSDALATEHAPRLLEMAKFLRDRVADPNPAERSMIAFDSAHRHNLTESADLRKNEFLSLAGVSGFVPGALHGTSLVAAHDWHSVDRSERFAQAVADFERRPLQRRPAPTPPPAPTPEQQAERHRETLWIEAANLLQSHVSPRGESVRALLRAIELMVERAAVTPAQFPQPE